MTEKNNFKLTDIDPSNSEPNGNMSYNKTDYLMTEMHREKFRSFWNKMCSKLSSPSSHKHKLDNIDIDDKINNYDKTNPCISSGSSLSAESDAGRHHNLLTGYQFAVSPQSHDGKELAVINNKVNKAYSSKLHMA
ncbi:MAG: hypothetical protein MHPSP_000508 [Paramarteilia canceri]